ncbi:MAG TPA: NAD(P)-dependent oxidoreductase [Vicinamibacterales bacterium]|nr:NAD(P)-dependent oxidoreductase [Vicinamibacterales bacterium]
MADTPRVGFVGLGRMGRPMCRNLLRAGFPLIVYNRSRPAVDELADAGAHPAASLAEVAAGCEFVLTCLPTVEASEEIYLSADGLIGHGRSGQVFIEHSTIGPSTARRIAGHASPRGIGFLDAPVSGGPEGAADATLTIMVGGEAADAARAAPVLRALGRHIHHLGGAGTGSAAKLVNQALTAVHAAAAAEALLLASAAGLDPLALLDVLSTSYGQSRMLDRSGPRMVAHDFAGAAPLRLLIKDLRLVREMADETGIDLRLVAVAERLCGACEMMGLSEADLAAIVLPLERDSGRRIDRA